MHGDSKRRGARKRATTRAQIKEGHFLSRLWRKITNRNRPTAGWDLRFYRGSALPQKRRTR